MMAKMFEKVSIKFRLTIMTALLIMCVCIGLNVVLYFSANRLANSIETSIISIPSQETNSPDLDQEILPMYPLNTNDDTQQAMLVYKYESVIFTIIAVVFGGGLTYYVAGKALDPVRELNKKIKNISAFNLSETIDVPQTNDDLAELTASFNEMTSKLNESFLMQQRFSASAAHELRTPLTILQTKIDVFNKKGIHTNDEYDILVSDVKKQTSRLRSLISDLLDMTLIEETVLDEFVLNDLFEDIIEELSMVAMNKNVVVSFKCDKIAIVGNIELLHRAFYNLIENSIKYNVHNGKVEITAYKNDNGKVTVLIKDTGIGIPNEMKKQIFEPFFRVDKSRSRDMGGAGLGLSLVDTIIKKHSGSILVTDNINNGSCFEITLFNNNLKP